MGDVMLPCSRLISHMLAGAWPPTGALRVSSWTVALRFCFAGVLRSDANKLDLRSFGQRALPCVDDDAAPPASGHTLRGVFVNPLSCSPRLLLESFRACVSLGSPCHGVRRGEVLCSLLCARLSRNGGSCAAPATEALEVLVLQCAGCP